MGAERFAEAFLAIMGAVCEEARMDISERVVWLQKAEGAWLSYRKQMVSVSIVVIECSRVRKWVRERQRSVKSS